MIPAVAHLAATQLRRLEIVIQLDIEEFVRRQVLFTEAEILEHWPKLPPLDKLPPTEFPPKQNPGPSGFLNKDCQS